MDEEIRALERATSAGELESALRLAHLLERVGRADDVLSALLIGRDSPAIRREIGARWDRLYLADARFVDVKPVARPHVRWLTKVDGRDQVHTLLAHPLGVVASTKKRTLVFDPETGEPSDYDDLPSARCPLLAGDVLLLFRSNQVLEGYDLATGERLHATKLIGHTDMVFYAGGLLLTGNNGGHVRAHRLLDPRSAPTFVWTRPCARPAHVRLTRSRVLLIGAGFDGFLALDHDGTTRWGYRSLDSDYGVVDDDLVVLDRSAGPALGADDGTVRWQRTAGCHALALAKRAVILARAEHVMMRVEDSPQARATHGDLYDWREVDVVDRATGTRLATLAEDRYLGGTAVARDVLYAVVGTERSAPTISARSLDGTRLWQLPHKELGKSAPHSLAPAPGRLYVAGDHFVACVEDTT